MNLNSLLNEVEDNADLLTRSDEWLEAERKSISSKIEVLAEELQSILTAQRVKKKLQQKNLVAVQSLVKDAEGTVIDIIVRILNLPDAISLLKSDNNSVIDQLNMTANLAGWHRDGYDISTSATLR